MRLAGVVLAGGAGRRLGGVDKPLLQVGGTTLLRRAVAALHAAEPVVVVGPRRGEALTGVLWTREDPPRSGPVAALAAGLELLTGTEPDDLVAVLASDLPGITPATVDRLAAAVGSGDGAVLRDAGGHRQWLIGVWRCRALRAALPADPAGASLRGTLATLAIADVPALPGEADDVDTPEDLARGESSPR